jgi:hypothetical protein
MYDIHALNIYNSMILDRVNTINVIYAIAIKIYYEISLKIYL